MAISLLAMDSQEVEVFISNELRSNPCLQENYGYYNNYDNNIPTVKDFREYLLEQVKLHKFNKLECDIAEVIIYSLDDDGLLLDCDIISNELTSELALWPEWIESVRIRLMYLDPLGCGAQSVQEALIFQARALYGTEADVIINLIKSKQKNFYKLLSSSDYNYLKNLRPRPAQDYANIEKNYHDEPDLVVYKNSQSYYVDLSRRPSKRIICERPVIQDKQLLKYFNKAQFLLKSLRYREHNLRGVAESIVRYQAPWFFHDQPLRALSLKQIADDTNLHESTISRLVRHKFISCDRGLFELKYFFSSKIKAANYDCSSKHIKNLIKNIITQENIHKPLSDQTICLRLNRGGFDISRRTVTKYRQSLRIKAAYERKSEK
jgi:RNA polymerase sigma-54 factor